MECNCGSGLERFPLHDARGIFCTFVCDSCEAEKKETFRVDIFDDPDYFADEDIEES